MKKRRQIDSRRILNITVLDAENLTDATEPIDFAALDHADIREWARSVRKSRRGLSAFIRRLESELPTGQGPQPLRAVQRCK